jgi:ComF family protein
MKLGRGLYELIYPSRCLACGILSQDLCTSCREEWRFQTFRTRIDNLLVISSAPYNSVAKQILLASKEDGIRQGDDLLVLALENSLRQFSHFDITPSTLVPIPSSRKSNRKRGRDFVCDIASRLGESSSHSVQSLLIHDRRILDQSGLSAVSRAENVKEAFRVLVHHARPRQVILVDDLLTTGATLREAARTLESSGVHVSGAITAFLAQPLR